MMTYEMALQRLSALCASAEHCEYEMTEKMRKWEVEESDCERIMEYLRKAKFVDDERYARAFVKDKIKYNKWGRRKVEQGLWAKHIAEDIRQRVLDEVDESQYKSVLTDLLKSKRRSIKAANDYEMNRKLIKFALSRGFDYSIVRHCIDCDDYDEEDSTDDF
ncbi:MAG: regulatory protein RecX [Prevotellaceae bacterium]|nr:regulatory protein RecX [Prevotellaceae bacterium]